MHKETIKTIVYVLTLLVLILLTVHAYHVVNPHTKTIVVVEKEIITQPRDDLTRSSYPPVNQGENQ